MPQQEPFCSVDRRDHFNICATLEINSRFFYGRPKTEHQGIELCFDSGTPHHRRVGNKQLVLEPGKIMAFNALEEHAEECSKDGPVHHSRAVIFDFSFIDQLTCELGIRPRELVFTAPASAPTPGLQSLLRELFVLRDTPGISHVAFDCVATELVLALLSQTDNTGSDRIRAAADTGHYPRAFARAKKIMRELVPAEDVSLGRIAALSGLSKFHFVRLFKSCTGLSPIQYYNRLKTDHVKQQLRHTDAGITDITYRMGYSDISTFEKSFRKICLMSPSQYRRQNSLKRQRPDA